jgi:hypothetical protein
MILELSTTYWATGIILTWHPDGARDQAGNKVHGWSGEVGYYDDGFRDDDTDAGKLSTQGTLRTRYVVADGTEQTAVRAIVDTLIADAQRLGIEFRTDGDHQPRLYVPGDGEWADHPLPEGWRELLAAEAARIGWDTYAPQAVQQ